MRGSFEIFDLRLLIADCELTDALHANPKSEIKNLKLPKDAKRRSERRMPRPLDYQKSG